MTRRVALCAVALLVACNGDETTSEPEGPPFEHPDPTPYEPGIETPGLEASLTVADVEASAPQVISLAAAMQPSVLVAAYEAMMVHADGTCPSIEVVDDGMGSVGTYWTQFEPCTAMDGTVFRGVVRYNTIQGASEATTTLSSEGSTFEIVAPDGTSMGGSAIMESTTYTEPGQVIYSMYFVGDLLVDPSLAAGNPWLLGQARGTVTQYAAEVTDGRFRGFGGNFAILDDSLAPGIGAASFDELAALEFPGCTGAGGRLSLRDTEGAWHDAIFAPPEEEDPTVLCNACADLSFLGEELGEACPPLSTFADLVSWETTPW